MGGGEGVHSHSHCSPTPYNDSTTMVKLPPTRSNFASAAGVARPLQRLQLRKMRSSATAQCAAVASQSICAPPTRFGTMSSITPRPARSLAVSFSASAALVLRAGRLPQDRGAALRRDDAVDGVLQHQHDTVGDAERQRTATAALADDHGDDGHVQPRHLAQVPRDRLRLPALLRAETRVGAGRVDQRDDRACRTSPPAASAAAPCGNPPGAASRSCAAGSPSCRGPSDGRSPSRWTGRPGGPSRTRSLRHRGSCGRRAAPRSR
jgi:hypothetical protein